MQRRSFITHLSGAAALYTLQSVGLVGCSKSPMAPSPAPGTGAGVSGGDSLELPTVRSFGARGDGVSDDTDAIMRAVTTLGATGRVVSIPDGVYLIDPKRSIVLPSGTELRLNSGAVLRALPVASAESAVIVIRDASNVTVSGGTIIGERAAHLGTTGEWGFGIDVRGSSDVKLSGITVRDCWGDGIYVGAGAAGESQRVTISECRSLGNRRQGLSLTACVTALVERSEFSGTNGTAPQSGIDLEPNAGFRVTGVTVRDCTSSGNVGAGILLVGDRVTNCVLESNTATGNGKWGGIALLHGPSGITVRGNTVELNGGPGVWLYTVSGSTVSDNSVRLNSQAQSAQYPNVLIESRSTGNEISSNVFKSAGGAGRIDASYDVSIDADCTGNRVIRNVCRAKGVDAQGRSIGGIRNMSPTTVVADNI